MHKLTAPLLLLLAPFARCFNPPVHDTFCLVVPAWIVCLGRRTIARVWQTTGYAEHTDHSSAYRLFNQAQWNGDELARIFLVELLCEMLEQVARWLPKHTLYFTADSASIGKHLLKGLPEHVQAIGPIHPKAKRTS